MAECWAACLGDCRGGISKEHYISQAVSGTGSIAVRGFPWCRDEVTVVPVASFARNMLCEGHNSALSPIDTAGGNAFAALRRFVDIAWAKTKRGVRLKGMQQYRVDGHALERWLLKTTINIAYGRELFAGARWKPPADWVETAYGRSRFADGAGLSMASTASSIVRPGTSTMGIQFLHRNRSELIGAELQLNNFSFVISVLPIEGAGLVHRPERLIDKPRLQLHQVLRFDW